MNIAPSVEEIFVVSQKKQKDSIEQFNELVDTLSDLIK